MMIFSKRPIVLIIKPIPTATPKTPNIAMIELGSLEGIIFKIGACGVPKRPVTHSEKGSSRVSLEKNSPVSKPISELVIPMDIKIGANLFQLPTFITFLAIRMPASTKTSPCPKSPNIIPKRSVKKIATNGVGSIVP